MSSGLWLRMNTISELSVDSSRGEMMDINVRVSRLLPLKE